MRAGVAALTIGLWLGGASFAGAEPASQTPSVAAADQIAAGPVATDIDAGQISGASLKAATSINQLSGAQPRVEAPAQLPSHSQGRDTSVGAIGGHDRCDPAAGASAHRPDCARIIDNRADEFAHAGDDQAAPAVNANAPAASMVNDIVNGGTGTIVTLPAK
jgi:hypothetical protein